MPGTIIIDPASFTAAFVMAVTPKEVFGHPGQQEKNAADVPKWTAAVAVTYAPDGTGMAPSSEVLNVTITTHDNPAQLCPPGTPVVFEQLRAGVSAPEQRADGRGVRGGRLYWMATAIRPAHGANGGRPLAAAKQD